MILDQPFKSVLYDGLAHTGTLTLEPYVVDICTM